MDRAAQAREEGQLRRGCVLQGGLASGAGRAEGTQGPAAAQAADRPGLPVLPNQELIFNKERKKIMF